MYIKVDLFKKISLVMTNLSYNIKLLILINGRDIVYNTPCLFIMYLYNQSKDWQFSLDIIVCQFSMIKYGLYSSLFLLRFFWSSFFF
jgi:hypothetical protein